jgi:hypothetical protein
MKKLRQIIGLTIILSAIPLWLTYHYSVEADRIGPVFFCIPFMILGVMIYPPEQVDKSNPRNCNMCDGIFYGIEGPSTDCCKSCNSGMESCMF